MTDYLSEEERAEAAKRWLRENGLFLVGGLVLGLGGLFGWNQWQAHQQAQAEQASAIYEELLVHVQAQRVAEAEDTLARLETASSTGYADHGRLMLAAMHMERSAPDRAAAFLRDVVEGRGAREVRDIARLRLARLLLHKQDPDGALALLERDVPEAMRPHWHEIRGDIHAALGDTATARREYRQAVDLDGGQGIIDRGYVEAKLNTLEVAGPDERVGTVRPETVLTPDQAL